MRKLAARKRARDWQRRCQHSLPFSNALDQDVTSMGAAIASSACGRARCIPRRRGDPNNENKAVYMPYLTLRKLYPEVKDNL